MNHSRRRFIGVLPAPALLSQQSPNDTIRVAFVGLGNRGSFLLRHSLKFPSVRVVALCDLETDQLRKAVDHTAAAGHRPATYTDFRKMLDAEKDLDAVVIATPVDTHRMISLAALEIGKHVYCEKPMANKSEDVRLMVNAARSAKGIFQLGFQLRHDPNRRAAMEFIQKGGIGRLLFCQGYRHQADLPRWIPWLFDRARSGDGIVEQGCHMLDLFTWAIGKPPLRAFGSGGINLYKDVPPGRTTMDNYGVIYEFPDDIRVVFSHLLFDPPGFSGNIERVFGSTGAVDLERATWTELGKKGEIQVPVPDKGQDPNHLSLAAFFDNARNKRAPLNNAESGALSTLVAIMGRLSIYERRVVTWEEVAQ